ncbi:MAG: RsmB/NOP family class I SAM-dependent RNA methyltransferase [Devosiaceae bacterium]
MTGLKGSSGSKQQRRPGSSKPASARDIPGLSARARAADLLHGVVEGGKPLDGAFEGYRTGGKFAGADRALTHAIVLTALRQMPTLDAAINACLDKPLHASAAQTMAIMRVMAAQLLIMDIADHAAVTLGVEDAARRKDTRKLKGLVNAVGRRMVREKQTLLAAPPRSNVPIWLAQRWALNFGSKRGTKIAKALMNQPAIDLSLKPDADRPALMEAMAQYDPIALPHGGIRLSKPGSIDQLSGYEQGLWWVQDFAASLPAHVLLGPLENPAAATVLDLCAAPGGKTAQMASAGATVTALDQSAQRMKRLGSNMERLKLSIQSVVEDATRYVPKEKFDAVLLDAPCSATGTLRRNPDISYLRKEGDIRALAKLQTTLLNKAATLVKPGGHLVYATCSLEPEEGEAQITRFLTNHAGWVCDPILEGEVPKHLIAQDGTLRTLPHLSPTAEHDDGATGMDGFYIARLIAPN